MPLPIQGNIFSDSIDVKSNLLKKSQIVTDAFDFYENFVSSRGKLMPKKLIASIEYVSAYEIGFETAMTIKNIELEKDKINDYPSVYVVVFTDPDVQAIAISRNAKAFKDSYSVLSIIEKQIGARLAEKGLRMGVIPILKKDDFWDIIEKYEGRITKIKFTIDGINMSPIHKNLKTEYAELIKSTSSFKSELSLESGEGFTLTSINKENESLVGLSEMTVKGGSHVEIRAKGVSGKIETKEAIQTYKIDELDIKSNDAKWLEDLKNSIITTSQD